MYIQGVKGDLGISGEKGKKGVEGQKGMQVKADSHWHT